MRALGTIRSEPLLGSRCLPWLARVLVGDSGRAAHDLDRGAVHTAEVEQFAKAYRLGPLLARRGDIPELRCRLPDPLFATWQDAYVRQWLANESLLQAFHGIRRSFVAAGEAFLLLKGPHLAQRFYGDLGERMYEDVDLLVPADRAEPCLDWLVREHAFVSPVRSHWLHRRLTHAKQVYRGNLDIDLHWGLRSHPSFSIDEERIWATRGTLVLPGSETVTVEVLSDEYALVLSLLSIFDDLSRLEAPVKGMVDAFLVLRKLDAETDWPSFLARRRAEGLDLLVTDVLAMLLHLFEARSLLPSLAASLSRNGDGDCRGLDICLRPTSRIRALWSYRCALYRMPRPLAFSRALCAAPVLTILMHRSQRRKPSS